jgi:hypothetical protein
VVTGRPSALWPSWDRDRDQFGNSSRLLEVSTGCQSGHRLVSRKHDQLLQRPEKTAIERKMPGRGKTHVAPGSVDPEILGIKPRVCDIPSGPVHHDGGVVHFGIVRHLDPETLGKPVSRAAFSEDRDVCRHRHDPVDGAALLEIDLQPMGSS